MSRPATKIAWRLRAFLPIALAYLLAVNGVLAGFGSASGASIGRDQGSSFANVICAAAAAASDNGGDLGAPGKGHARQRFSADFLKGDSNENFPGGGVDADGFLPRNVLNEHFRAALYQTSLDLTGHFTTWELKHTLLLGADYLNELPHDTGANFAQSSSINIFTLAQQGPFTVLSPTVHSSSHPQWYGLYLQDQIELPYGFHLLAGMRYDNARNPSSFVAEDGSAPQNTPNTASAVNPRVGLLWRPIPQISLYGSYVSNFGLPNGLFQSGDVKQALPPTTAPAMGGRDEDRAARPAGSWPPSPGMTSQSSTSPRQTRSTQC